MALSFSYLVLLNELILWLFNDYIMNIRDLSKLILLYKLKINIYRN